MKKNTPELLQAEIGFLMLGVSSHTDDPRLRALNHSVPKLSYLAYVIPPRFLITSQVNAIEMLYHILKY